MQEYLEKLNWRYATKLFDPAKKLSDEMFETLTETLRLAPSSYGQQPWKFLHIVDGEIRKALQPHTFNQPQVVDASHFLVLCAKDSVDDAHIEGMMQDIADERDVKRNLLMGFEDAAKGFVAAMTPQEQRHWGDRQVYIALGFLLSAAAQHGVDACPIEGFVPAEYDKVLKLEGTGYHSVACVALGYRAENDILANQKKVRLTRERAFEVV